eukprot:TRINITY_DN28968_c0_g1_i1.p1 TRINITY_DN28968_c0_g1~~TRINITY_DN28968_c0_g1_i1.p1  ORF type:complete len:593 (-),score=80.11 TRINITY_DN28968_c0_g1_i1:214-1992(-)
MFVTAILLYVAQALCASVAAAPASGMPVRAAGFLQANLSSDVSLRQKMEESRGFQQDIRHSMMSALGCGAPVSAERLMKARVELLPTWFSLPKNEHGRVDWRTLRYVSHRYFVHRWSIWIRGFEPSLQNSESNGSIVDIIGQRIPKYERRLLESSHGFSLSDVVYIMVVLEQVVLDSAQSIIKHVYRDHNLPSSKMLNRSELEILLHSYLIRWVVADDDAVVKAIVSAPHQLASITSWDDIVAFAHGQIRSFDFSRQRLPQAGRGRGALEMRYSFEDVHEIIDAITTTFASFWQSECNAAKRDLVALDTQRSGRVRLAKFYGNARRPDQHFVFTDSEAYLRSLGALDESSSLRGKELIIPNYMQSATNCVISTSHYLVCCPDECEKIFRDIEVIAGAASSPPAKVLMIVENLTMQTSLEDDEAVYVDGFLRGQLEEIASLHDGRVPFHGRLFAQWLHFIFPRDCPFPQVGSTLTTLTTAEFGGGFEASEDEMRQYIEDPLEDLTDDIYSMTSRENLDWTSQWSSKEHLFAGRWDIVSPPGAQGEQFVSILSTAMATGAAVISLLIVIRRLCGVPLCPKSEAKSVDVAFGYLI